jgi:hypothetical protein
VGEGTFTGVSEHDTHIKRPARTRVRKEFELHGKGRIVEMLDTAVLGLAEEATLAKGKGGVVCPFCVRMCKCRGRICV